MVPFYNAELAENVFLSSRHMSALNAPTPNLFTGTSGFRYETHAERSLTLANSFTLYPLIP